MAEQTVVLKQDDAETLKSLLRSNGLLLQLPQQTFDTLYPNEDHVAIYADQIERNAEAASHLSELWDVRDELQQVVMNIGRLAQLERGCERAMYCIIFFATQLFDSHIEFEKLYLRKDYMVYTPVSPDDACMILTDILNTLDSQLVGLLHKRYMGKLKSPQSCNLTALQSRIRQACNEAEKEPRDFLVMSMWYLAKYHKRQTAELLAYKVVGHRMSPELIEMVTDSVYDDVDLTIDPKRWTWSFDEMEGNEPILEFNKWNW